MGFVFVSEVWFTALKAQGWEGFYLTMDRELILVLEQVYLFKNWWDFFVSY